MADQMKNGARGFLAGVPETDLAILADGPEKLGLEVMPGDVIDCAFVVQHFLVGFNRPAGHLLALDVPNTDFRIVSPGKQVPSFLLIPAQPKSIY